MKKIIYAVIAVLVLIALVFAGRHFFGKEADHVHDHEHAHKHEHDHANTDEMKSEIRQGRLLISDADGKLYIYSLAKNEILQSLETKMQISNIYTTADKKFGVVADRNNSKVIFIDSGFDLESHGDHYDPKVYPPKKLDLELNYPTPTHMQTGPDAISIFFDGIGKKANPVDEFLKKGGFVTIENGELEYLQELPYAESTTNVHGSAEFIDGYVIAGARLKNKFTPLGDTLGLYKKTPQGYDLIKYFAIDANGLHGSATAGNYVLFAPEDGVILLEKQGDKFIESKIALPESLTSINCNGGKVKNVRIGSFAANKNSPNKFFGNACKNLFLINAKTQSIEPYVWWDKDEAKVDVHKYTFDTQGDYFVFLDSAGFLDIAEVAKNFALKTRVKIFDNLEVTGHNAPNLFVHGQAHKAYVVKSEAKSIVEIDLVEGKIAREIKLDFEPTKANWLGLTGEITFHH